MAMSSWKHIWVIYILFLNFNISHLYIERNRERERERHICTELRHPVCLKTSKDPSKQSTTIPPCKGSQQFSSGTLRWHRGTCNFLGQLSWGAPGVPCHRLRSTSQAARDRATKAKVRRPVCAFRGSRPPKLTQKIQGKNGEKTGMLVERIKFWGKMIFDTFHIWIYYRDVVHAGTVKDGRFLCVQQMSCHFWVAEMITGQQHPRSLYI